MKQTNEEVGSFDEHLNNCDVCPVVVATFPDLALFDHHLCDAGKALFRATGEVKAADLVVDDPECVDCHHNGPWDSEGVCLVDVRHLVDPEGPVSGQTVCGCECSFARCPDCGHDFIATNPEVYDCRVAPYLDMGDPVTCGCDNDFHSVKENQNSSTPSTESGKTEQGLDAFAREIIERVSDAALELAFIRHSLTSDEFDRDEYPDIASQVKAQEAWWENDIKPDALDCLTGDETGCAEPEDLNESNCVLIWLKSKLATYYSRADIASKPDSEGKVADTKTIASAITAAAKSILLTAGKSGGQVPTQGTLEMIIRDFAVTPILATCTASPDSEDVEAALKELQCFQCGERVITPLSENMAEYYLEQGRKYDSGELVHNDIANQRAPFWQKGQCPMCQPLRDFLAKSRKGNQ